MIVQSEAADGSHFVLTMEQHTATGAVLAEHFGGTSLFDRPEPRDLFVELVAEHDRGWVPIDEKADRDPSTDLPWSVFDAPLAHSLAAGVGTIDYNEGRHPFRGLLSSMHISGIHNGRFGLTEANPVDHLTDEDLELLAAFLDSEQLRRDRLTEDLAADSQTAAWVTSDVLMKCYKALQFFDMLALWLQVTHPSDRSPMVWSHVPGRESDYQIHFEQVDEVRVRLEPFPFDVDELPLVISGRQLWPQAPTVDLVTALEESEEIEQTVLLIGPGQQ